MAPSIAALGWGSLIWKPAEHPGAPLAAQGVRAGLATDGGSWRTDGPELPLELALQATLHGDPEKQYVSWVITPGVPASPSLWTPLALGAGDGAARPDALAHAAAALAAREGVDASQIGRWPAAGAPATAVELVVGAWAKQHGVDGVVWTALAPKWGGAERAPREDEVVGYLQQLADPRHAEEYVRRTPRQTASPYRRAIERALGWTPEPARARGIRPGP